MLSHLDLIKNVEIKIRKLIILSLSFIAMPTSAQEVNMATAMRAFEKPVQQWRSAIKAGCKVLLFLKGR
jgi:hypothetical protein